MSHNVRVDLKLPPQATTWSDVKQAAQIADNSGVFKGLWFFDHLASVATGPNGGSSPVPIFDGWSLLAAVAAITERIRLGLMVASVVYRPLGVLANSISTIDHVSNGRLDLGLGAGNNEIEAVAYGITFPPPGVRITMLEESINAIRLLWRSAVPVTYSGSHVSLKNAELVLKPVSDDIPIWVGGKGEKRMLRIVAEHADYWNYSNGDEDDFSRRFGVLQQHAQNLGVETPQASVQVQVRENESQSFDRAMAYVSRGATHVVLYCVAEPETIERSIRVAERILTELNI